MFAWISENSAAISAISNIAMLVVWVAYLQIFLHSYTRQLRPKLVINKAAGSALDASCFVSNMSSESIYLESVSVTLTWDNHKISYAVTDLDTLEDENISSDPRERTLQGPLRPGDYTPIDTFGSLIDRVLRKHGEDPDSVRQREGYIGVEVMVIADYLSDNLLVGATRQFNAVFQRDRWLVQAADAETRQIRSRRERRKIKNLLFDED